MSVTNGQTANQDTFNTAFMSRNNPAGTGTTAIVDLNNADTLSGTEVTNLQRDINSIGSFTGRSANTAKTALPSWTNNQVGSSSDDLKTRADNLTAKFILATGHAHDGTEGNGKLIDATKLTNAPLLAYINQGTDLTGVTGGSKDVSTPMSGKTASAGSSAVGVVVTDPYNKIVIRTTTSYDPVEDSGGNQVYGRLTESSGTWTLTFYTDIAGVETSYSSFSSASISWWYQEIYNVLSGLAPVYSQFFNYPSDNAREDVPDATASLRGLISAGTQSLGGAKTWSGNQTLQAAFETQKTDVTVSGNIASLASTTGYIRLTGTPGGFPALYGITSGANGRRITVHNTTNAIVQVVSQSGSAGAAGERIKLINSTFNLAIGSRADFIYDSGQSRWIMQGEVTPLTLQQGVGYAAGPVPLDATGLTGNNMTTYFRQAIWCNSGAGGDVTVTSNPQIPAGYDPLFGDNGTSELMLIGTDDDNPITWVNGNGMVLNGDAKLTKNRILSLIYDNTQSKWLEVSRNF